MEIKKSQAATKESSIKRIAASDFVGEVKSEIKKIHWTEKDELISYTKIVVASTFFLGMGIYIVDLFIQSILSGLGTFARFITG